MDQLTGIRSLALVRRVAPASANAEDLASEALSRAYANWSRIGGSDYQLAWVLKVATNLAHDESRRLKRQRHAERTAAVVEDSFDDYLIDRLVLSRALSRLTRRQREAVVLHHMANLSIEDTARAMGVAAGTARTHLDRGIATLRHDLKTQG